MKKASFPGEVKDGGSTYKHRLGTCDKKGEPGFESGLSQFLLTVPNTKRGLRKCFLLDETALIMASLCSGHKVAGAYLSTSVSRWF